MPNWTIVQAINHALHVAMAADERVVVLGEDVGVNGGVFRVTEGLFDKYGHARMFDTAVPYLSMEERYLPSQRRVLRGFRQALAF